ncbi:uncharacterized protein LAESUDRAFT_734420 [Laetiporus sulphureus 93-53]|uniref:Uncharacterized protein n=1 Tax=Laetiporus sulphureus 93-53 TaxID=1314785 RepID=A0A165HEL4_9APHY|nr:uncharacterized protein LAESUDRAFT_734420 [Laetiporus sulphureus 93-53]KZT11634.1 hypothetical protein LAESUDRAFT_734420 [Laetiporus sulphureus 93-53]
MSTPAFQSFDPLATHPFTNNSGLLPKPAQPSQFPHPIPSSLKTVSANSPSSSGQVHTLAATPSLHAPQPRVPATKKSKSSAARPIFVPFRPERSSPELDDILLRKKVSDMLMNKSQWSIDTVTIPSGNADARKTR